MLRGCCFGGALAISWEHRRSWEHRTGAWKVPLLRCRGAWVRGGCCPGPLRPWPDGATDPPLCGGVTDRAFPLPAHLPAGARGWVVAFASDRARRYRASHPARQGPFRAYGSHPSGATNESRKNNQSVFFSTTISPIHIIWGGNKVGHVISRFEVFFSCADLDLSSPLRTPF